MLNKTLIAAAVAGWTMVAQATVFDYSQTWNSGFLNSGNVPDANITGLRDVQTVNFGAGTGTFRVTAVTVTLDIAGGWNGDLYAYLAHDGQKAVLLNRVGKDSGSPFGYGDAGMNVTFSDAAANNIHNYGSVGGSITGGALWQPDGRDSDPHFTLSSQSVTEQLSVFSDNHVLANGDWTLFIADMSGGSASQLRSWTLNVSAIPEPVGIALAVFGGLFGLVGLWRSKWAGKWFKQA